MSMRTSAPKTDDPFDFLGLSFRPPQPDREIHNLPPATQLPSVAGLSPVDLPMAVSTVALLTSSTILSPMSPSNTHSVWKKLLIATAMSVLVAGYWAYGSSHPEMKMVMQSQSPLPPVLPYSEEVRRSGGISDNTVEDGTEPELRNNSEPTSAIETHTKSAKQTLPIEHDAILAEPSAASMNSPALNPSDTVVDNPRGVTIEGKTEPQVQNNSSQSGARSEITSTAIEIDAKSTKPSQPVEHEAVSDEPSAALTSNAVHQISPELNPFDTGTKYEKPQLERRQIIAGNQVSVCHPSASAVKQEHPQARPSWTLHALGHEGTKCWYPATHPKEQDDPR
jgi:hypothetical protein